LLTTPARWRTCCADFGLAHETARTREALIHGDVSPKNMLLGPAGPVLLEVLVASIEAAGFVPGADVGIALDIAASEFGKGGQYTLGLDDVRFDTDAMIEKLLKWIERYPIVSIEDPLSEDDEAGMIAFTRAAGSKVQIVGDDFLVTRAALVDEAATNVNARRARGRAKKRLCVDCVSEIGGDRGRHDSPPRDRLERGAVECRSVLAGRAHGDVERRHSYRGW